MHIGMHIRRVSQCIFHVIHRSQTAICFLDFQWETKEERYSEEKGTNNTKLRARASV